MDPRPARIADGARAPIAPDAHATPSWWQQYWPSPGYAPLQRSVETDVVVIGAGITGCSAAWHLARAGVSSVVLEAREVASGASGRNGGFLVAGLAHRPVALAERVGLARAAELYAMTGHGRDRLFEVAADLAGADYAVRTGSLRLAMDEDELDAIDEEHALLEQMGVAVERLTRAELRAPLRDHFLGGLRFPGDGRSIPTGWVHALAAAAAAAGARIHEHTPVALIEDEPNGVVVLTETGLEVRARSVVVATEAWLSGLLPELAGISLPYRSQVLAALPPRSDDEQVQRLLPEATWSRRGWDYVQQTADGTLVIGGEATEDVELVRSWDEVTVAADQQWLESWLRRVLDVEPQVTARWAGVLGQTVDGFPLLGRLPHRPSVIVCGGWGGAGNVMGFVGGELVASLAREEGARIPVEMRVDRFAFD